MKNEIKINEIVNLKDERKGKVVGKLDNGEYMLARWAP